MSNEPIYRQVIRDVEARAEVGKPKYGRYLMNDPNGRDPLQDAYEEQIDGAKYLKQAIHERRALIEYVARLEGALRNQITGLSNIIEFRKIAISFSDGPRYGALTKEEISEVIAEMEATLATSPLSGQPQSAPATGWRPIAEAPKISGELCVGAWHCAAWIICTARDVYEAESRGYTHYHPLSAPPQEGE
jgi:hypothetical protein